MLRLICTVIVSSCVFYSANAQWNWINPKPENHIANKVIFTNDSTGYILNNGGSLIKTTDQGVNWFVANRFSMMRFIDILDSTAIIAGSAVHISVSHDNANSWRKILPGINTFVTGIDIVSRDTIFISTSDKLYNSFDRGLTWQAIPLPVGTTITTFEFVNSKLGFIGKPSTSILRTIDGGQTWTETAVTNTHPSDVLSIKFLNKDTGYAFRGHSDLLKTTDGGQTWTVGQVPNNIFAMSFPSDSVGYLAGKYGSVYKTSNAGLTWETVSPLPGLIADYDLTSIHFVNNNIGFATGLKGRIVRTLDGGAHWEDYSPLHELTDFSFPTPETGYASNAISIYKTTDSGKTWNALPLSPGNQNNSYFQLVHFFSRDTGFVTSTEIARVHHTTDGGMTWNSINPTGFYGYTGTSGLSFINDSTGFISLSTYYGYLLSKTNDRGRTWKGVDSSGFYGEIYDKVHFLNERVGFGLRGNQLYKTTDSARNWSPLLGNNNATLTSVWFINERLGFIADNYSSGFRRTIDSGRTWIPINLPIQNRVVLSIKFLDGKIGYATCASGSIYQTADSGVTWVNIGNVPYEATNIKANKHGFVYFGGKFGTIVSSSTDFVISPDYKCPGANTSFTSDVEGASYSWEVSTDNGQSFSTIPTEGLYQGISTKTLLINYLFGDFQGYKYRCRVNSSTYSSEFEVKLRYYFIGNIDNNWNNPFNWNCNAVPDVKADVVIGKGQVLLNVNATIRNLTILPGATLTVGAGNKLEITH